MLIRTLALLLIPCWNAVALGLDRRLSINARADGITTGSPLEAFVSYSIELSSFPDFAGTQADPNKFSHALINNLGSLQGANPFIRVGGNTQDFAMFDENQERPLIGKINSTRSQDYPTTITIGPSFFDAYKAWPNVKFSHGFNLGGNNQSGVLEVLGKTAPLACRALSNENLYFWEYGNEPDLFAGNVRPSDYNESDYVDEWLRGTRLIKERIKESCPNLLNNDAYGYLAPSFAGTNNHLKAPLAWSHDLDTDSNIKYFSSHNYISGANSLGVTLQGTLMNHTRTKLSVDAHVDEYNAISPGVPHIFGEANSLYNQGRPGLSNTFGAALWVLDFLLYSASVNIQRVHLHMGTNYRYQAWQPINGTSPTLVPPNGGNTTAGASTTNASTTLGTKAPYYGNVAAAAFLGNLSAAPVRIASLDTGGGDHESAYLAYVDNVLRRVLIINMNEYNYTVSPSSLSLSSSSSSSFSPTTSSGSNDDDDDDDDDDEGDTVLLNPPSRTVRTYSIAAGNGSGTAAVQRLSANGSDAITGITWDGWSYNWELARGRPVRLANVSVGETVPIVNGVVQVGVPDSSAVVLSLDFSG